MTYEDKGQINNYLKLYPSLRPSFISILADSKKESIRIKTSILNRREIECLIAIVHYFAQREVTVINALVFIPIHCSNSLQ